MQKRIERYDNVKFTQPIERKKNEFDYKHNPVTIFRDSKDEKGTNVVVKAKKQGDIYSILKHSVKSTRSTFKKPKEVNIKEIILNEIVNNNIWADDDINALFERIKEEYPDIAADTIEEAIEFVKQTVL